MEVDKKRYDVCNNERLVYVTQEYLLSWKASFLN